MGDVTSDTEEKQDKAAHPIVKEVSIKYHIKYLLIKINFKFNF